MSGRAEGGREEYGDAGRLWGDGGNGMNGLVGCAFGWLWRWRWVMVRIFTVELALSKSKGSMTMNFASVSSSEGRKTQKGDLSFLPNEHLSDLPTFSPEHSITNSHNLTTLSYIYTASHCDPSPSNSVQIRPQRKPYQEPVVELFLNQVVNAGFDSWRDGLVPSSNLFQVPQGDFADDIVRSSFSEGHQGRSRQR